MGLVIFVLHLANLKLTPSAFAHHTATCVIPKYLLSFDSICFPHRFLVFLCFSCLWKLQWRSSSDYLWGQFGCTSMLWRLALFVVSLIVFLLCIRMSSSLKSSMIIFIKKSPLRTIKVGITFHSANTLWRPKTIVRTLHRLAV